MARRVRRKRDERGILDVALSWPALFFGVLVVVQVVLYGHAQSVAQAAAEEGAAAARRYDGSAAAGESTAHRYLDELGPKLIGGEKVSVDRSTTEATVTVRGEVVSIIGLKLFSVEATSSGPVERYVPPEDAP
jgi:Flp pilus assembly protein TadG